MSHFTPTTIQKYTEYENLPNSCIILTMSMAAIIGLVIALIGAMGTIVWLAKRLDSRVDQTIATNLQMSALRDQLGQKTIECERAKFGEEKANQALTHERERAKALEEFISTYATNKDPNADLDPDDVDGRVLRFSKKWGAATEGMPTPGGKVSAGGDDLMRPD